MASAETTTNFSSARRHVAFAVLLIGAFLSPADFFIVNIALPSIQTSLSAANSEVQLVISGYAVAFAVFLVSAGRLGDLYGRKRCFMIGMAGFTASSAFCGFAGTGTELVIGRVLQGLAAAALVPQILATMRTLYSGNALSRALNLYSVTIGIAAVAGQAFGGALVSADLLGLGWRAAFLVNLPVGVVSVLAAWWVVPETSERSVPRLDVGGSLLISLTLACCILPLSVGRDQGWPLWGWVMLGATPLVLMAFLRFEDRLSRAGGMPLLDLALLAIPSFRCGVLASLLFFFTNPFYLFFSMYEQAGRGADPLSAGLVIVPYGVGLLTGSLVTTPLPRHIRAHLFRIGMTVQVTGYVAMAILAGALVDGPPMLAALFCAGFGQGIAIPRLFDLTLGDVAPAQAGLAAGIVNATLQMGGAIAIALIGAVFFAILGTGTGAADYGHALRAALLCSATALATAMLIGSYRPRRAR